MADDKTREQAEDSKYRNMAADALEKAMAKRALERLNIGVMEVKEAPNVSSQLIKEALKEAAARDVKRRLREALAEDTQKMLQQVNEKQAQALFGYEESAQSKNPGPRIPPKGRSL